MYDHWVPKNKCARLSATAQKQTTLWTQACLNLKKTHITEKSDRTKMEMVMLCTTGPASVPSKTEHGSMYVYARDILGVTQNSHCVFVLKTSQIEYSVVDCIQRYVKWNCSWMCHKTHSQLTLLFYTTISGDMRHSCFLYSKTSMSCGQIRTQPRLDEENTPRMGRTRSSVDGAKRGWDASTNSLRR